LSTKPARLISRLWLLLWISAIGACGDDSPGTVSELGGSGGRSGSGGSSSGRAGSGGAEAGGAQLGAACTKDTDCGSGFVCDMEITGQQPLPGAPGGQLNLSVFPGGSCTPRRLAGYNPEAGSCDPLEPRGAQGCGKDGVCSVIQQVEASGSVAVACRKACEPSATESGCDREGYTCDFAARECTEGCRSDPECRVMVLDSDSDGEGDAIAYDTNSAATCDLELGRCTHPAGTQANGQSCTRDDDCSDNGLCLSPFDALGAQRFPGGMCTRRGCDYAGLECDTGSVCEPVRPWLGESATEPLCLQRCKVGAEPADQRLGASGHGQGCRSGYRCHYNGGPGADAGVCVGGNYNDVKTNNIGAACKEDRDCYSPFGLGFCLRYALSSTQTSPGICTVLDCAAPGLPDDLCGPGNECVATGVSGDQTLCSHNCKAASECPSGFACTDDDAVAGTPKMCFPLCRTNADCRSGEQCRLMGTASGASSAGLCVLQ